MTRLIRVATCAITALAASACSSTKLTTAWRVPAAQPVAFTRILALAISDNQSFRRTVEEEICKRVQPVPCQEAYTVIPWDATYNVEEAKARVKAAGFDGAIVFRVIGEHEKVTWVPPTYGPTFWGYYGYAWPATYSPGYHRVDKLVRIETTIYSVTDDKLIWVGTTETMNPSSVPKLVDEVAGEVARDMREHGLLAARE
jgi:hypothetical protein